MSNFFENQRREKSREPHPVWRGIGFLMMILIPLLAFGLADIAVNYFRTQGNILPIELSSDVIDIPLYGPVADIKAVLLVGFVIALVLFSIVAIINAVMYGSTKKTNYQTFQSQPKKFKKKKKLYKPRYD